MKHRKAPQLNMGVNYIAKHNASIDEDSDPSHKLSTTIDFLEKTISSSSTTTASTTKSYNEPTIHNSSTLATKLTTLRKLKSTSLKTFNIRKTSHTSEQNLTVARPTHQTKNITKYHYANIIKGSTKLLNVSKNGKNLILVYCIYSSYHKNISNPIFSLINFNVFVKTSDTSIAGKEYSFSRLYLCSFIDCEMPDSQTFCPHNCHKGMI